MENAGARLWPFEHFDMHLTKMLPVKQREMGMGDRYGIHDEYHTPEALASDVIWSMTKEKDPKQFDVKDNIFVKHLAHAQ
jgi:hypothetical protein